MGTSVVVLEQHSSVLLEVGNDNRAKHVVDVPLGIEVSFKHDKVSCVVTAYSAPNHHASTPEWYRLTLCRPFPHSAIYTDSPVSSIQLEPALIREQYSLPVPVLPML